MPNHQSDNAIKHLRRLADILGNTTGSLSVFRIDEAMNGLLDAGYPDGRDWRNRLKGLRHQLRDLEDDVNRELAARQLDRFEDASRRPRDRSSDR